MTALGPGSRVLLTGSTGLIGRRVARLVAGTGAEVHGVSRTGSNDPFETHVADLLDERDVDRLIAQVVPTHLVHLAWTTTHGHFWDDPVNLDWAAGAMRLLRRFHLAGGHRALFVGSCAEYDWSEQGPFREDQAGSQPATLYGAAKLAAATATVAYGATCGVEVAWARLFHLYGLGEAPERLVPQLLKAAAYGEPLELAHPGQVLDLLHVDDVAAALVAVLNSRASGAVNVASGSGLSLADLAAQIAEIAGLVKPPESRRDGRSSERSIVADVGRLRGETDFQPRIPLAEGLLNIWDSSQQKETT